MVAINGTSAGYLGTSAAPSINTQEWAEMAPGFGERYWVKSQTAARVTVVSGTTIRIGAGASTAAPQYIGGSGVVDKLIGPRDMTLPVPAANGTVHHMVVERRRWETVQASAFEAIMGGATRTTLPTRTVDPGKTADDHPLALVAVTKNGATVTASVTDDLRAVGGKGRYEATSELVLQYMTDPGTVVRIAGNDWVRTMDGSWLKNPGLPRNGWVTEYSPGITPGTYGNGTRLYIGKSYSVKPFPRLMTVQVFGRVGFPERNAWTANVEIVDIPSDAVQGKGTTIASQTMETGSAGTDYGFAMTACHQVAAGQASGLRVWLTHGRGNDGIQIYDSPGLALRVDWVETTPGNDW